MSKKGHNSMGKEGAADPLWQAVTRQIKAYHPARKEPTHVPRKPSSRVVAAPTPPLRYKPSDAAGAERAGRGFDRSTETKLKRGKLPIDGRIDLHGLTQEAAFNAFSKFILSAAHDGKRTLLVITGKGLKSEGVLKRMLPLWAEDTVLSKHILAVTEAQARDGGAGAFYVRLRRDRKK